jgi:hypothetical protein
MSAIPVRSIRLLPKSKKELDRLSGAKGEIFYDSTSKTIRVFDGTIIGGTLLNASVTVTDNPPANPTNGSLWFNSSNGGIYIYYTDGDSNQWVQPFVPAGAGGSGGDYTLPIASTTALGGVKIDGSTITINNGVISSASAYSLPIASTTILGGIRVDGTTVTINPQGVISAVSVAPSSNSFSTISVSGQSDVVADSSTDVLTIIAGSGITITTSATNDSLTIANSATATSSFSNISVAGQSTVVADNATDTLTLVAGTNVSITTNATNDSITINSGYDQSLNTANDVIFNTVTAGQLISSGTGVPTYTSGTDFIFNTGNNVGALILNGDLEVTGTVNGVTKAMVGLGNVTNESKATMFTDPTFTGTATIPGYAPLDSPTFTGTVSGITSTMVGLGNVTNESKVTMFSSPTFTGTVSGVTATHVGLGNVANESKATMFTNPTFTGTATFSKSTEIYFLKTGATGTVVHDFAESAIWSHENILANFTANFTNIPTTSGRITVVTLLLVQGATPRIPNAVQIDGVSQTIRWLNGSAPTGTANRGELVSFTLIRSTIGSFWTVAGSLTSYG